jgi:hypothetical protein
VQLILDFEPDAIVSTPSYMLAIADEFERQGVDPRSSSLRVALLGAEPWTNEMRRAIEGHFGLDAVECYGLSEVIGPGVAAECAESKDGCHVWEDHFYPEIIDPVSGRVLPDGEFGELVLTSLTKEALPVVRYRTRDLTRLLPGTARPVMRRIAKITGRSDDAGPLGALHARGVAAPPPRRARGAGGGQAGVRAGGRGCVVARRARARAPHQVLRRGQHPRRAGRPRHGGALRGQGEARDRPAEQAVMSQGFLIFAVLLNAGFGAVVFWWVYREFRRTRRKE